ncbi:MAG: hypothetical protein SGCHY_002616 [Lobulomycetales sp.]
MIPDIPGQPVGRYAAELRGKVADLLGRKNPGKFPGAQPVSFASKHIQELMNENYFCSEKADGVRVLLFSHVQKDTGKPEIFLACTSLPPPINSHQIDRKNEYYYLPEWTLPTPDLKGFLDNTLLDAELVIDKPKGSSEAGVLWLLLFDCIVYDGKNLCERTYIKRLVSCKS